MTFFSLFAGADLIGEFETREDAERALDELIAAEPSAADEFAVFEFDENGKRVGEAITRAAANANHQSQAQASSSTSPGTDLGSRNEGLQPVLGSLAGISQSLCCCGIYTIRARLERSRLKHACALFP